MTLNPYIVSLGLGILVGVLYGLLNTRSPAPPIIALLGLLGMLAGETAVSWAKSRIATKDVAAECLHDKSFSPDRADKGCAPTDPDRPA